MIGAVDYMKKVWRRRFSFAAADPFPGFIAKDSFTRADAAVPGSATEKGGAWTVIANVWGILTNRMYCTGATGGLNWLGATANGTLQATIMAVDFGRYLHCLAFRGTDINNLLYAQPSNTTITLNSRVAGAVTSTASGTATFSNSSAVVVKVVFNGASVIISVGGVVKINTVLTGTALAQAGTLAGDFFILGGGTALTTNNWIDDYSLTP